MNNARIIREGLEAAGLTVYGGRNAPYIWVKTPGKLSSWDFFEQAAAGGPTSSERPARASGRAARATSA